MKKIVSNIIPLKGFVALTLWPVVFVRKDREDLYTWKTENHENIHAEQQKEMYVVGFALALILCWLGCSWWSLLAVPLFFWVYYIEWLIKWAYYRNRVTAYCNISFEREAYDNQDNMSYIECRRPYKWIYSLWKKY